MASKELSGPLTARTSVLLSEPMKEAALVVAERRGVGIGNLLRQGLEYLLRVDRLQTTAASPGAEPRCSGCRWWGNQGRDLPYAAEFLRSGGGDLELICRNRRSDLYETVTPAAGGCPSFRGA